MKAREFVVESAKTASAEQVWNYVDGIHPDDQKGGGFLKSLIVRNPQYELKRVPLSSIHIPDQEYDDEEQDPEEDPYNRVQTVDPEHAGEYSANFVDRRPIVIDSQGWIIDGNHRAWAAANLLNKSDIMAWVPVKELNEISDERLQSYLSRAGKQVDSRLDRMSQARERLNKGWEIYDHNDPTRIIDRFEANSPREAQQYYQNFIDNHNPGDENFEFYLRRSTGIMEIARIPQGDFGDKDTLEPMATMPKTKPLPGGSRFSYAVNQKNPEFMEIMIFDNNQLVAELDLFATLDPLNTWGIETVATDPDYRGQGLGKALYGIALNILKLTLEAGATQTKHGQAMWIMLNSIPGVEVLGYAMEPTEDYRQKRGDQIVDQNATWTRYTFPVEPGSRSMRSTRRGTGIYSSNRVSMIAKWTGR
jgi:ribosomal protein S18 acetylase RimI-like enzyme